MHPVVSHGYSDPFSRSNEPQNAQSPYFDDFRVQQTIFWVIQILTSKMPKFFVDVRQDLGYESGWTSRQVRPIFKVKRVPKRAYPPFRRFSCAIENHFLCDSDSGIKSSNIFCGRPLRPKIWSRFTPHIQSDPFSRSNEQRSAHTPHFDDFRVL